MLAVGCILVLSSVGSAERLRWQVHPVSHVDVPNASITVINGWGSCGETCFEDLDANGVIDVNDLLSVLAHFQTSP